jgi:hypothetical protein
MRVGAKYGKLTIIGYSHTDKRWRKHYFVKCDCGTEKIIHGSSMISGNTRSCGCLRKVAQQHRRKPNNGGELTAIILGYKHHASRRGLNWDLTRDQVNDIIRKDCYYCGSQPSNLKKTRNSTNGLLYNGIDRFDNTKGYIYSNVVPCCKQCNMAKRDISFSDFVEWVNNVAQNLSRQPPTPEQPA